jgi:hypothetical protein
MKKIFVFASAVILGLSLAQSSDGFEVIRTPGANNQMMVTESLVRAVNLKMRCVGTRVEVVLDPKVRLNRNVAPLVSWRFDDAPVRQQRWNFAPESGILLLPQNLTQQFLEGIADSSQTRMTLPDQRNPTWQTNFNSTNFRQAFAELPCNGSFNAILSNPSTMSKLPTQILDATVAFVAPLEFTQAFGGRFEPENNKLVWEYNGVKLLLERGSRNVQNVFGNSSFELPRPVQILGGRTVVPARLVSAFNCKIAQTKPTDAVVKVTCGAGTTLMERELPRY